ncbi:MAG TPA: FecR family protein [Candidatus Limnocylindrales bacterium]|nr:FecR family protein [Candidatus Limnocylindrales bacterium]
MLNAVVAAAVFVACSYAVPALAQDAGQVVSMEGTVEIGRDNAFTAATVGSRVRVGDTIRTGNPGRARILFQDDSVLNVGDDTVLAIDESVFNPDEGTISSVIRLFQGKVRALVSDYYGESAASYRIATPTSVSGVRGTEFIVAHDVGTETSQVLGLGGRVAVHSVMDLVRRGVIIRPREITFIARGQFPTPPRQIEVSDDIYRALVSGVEFPGSGVPEGNADKDPIVGGKEVPVQDQPGNVPVGVESPDKGQKPISDIPPEEPGKTGGDMVGEPVPVITGPTDLDIEF